MADQFRGARIRVENSSATVYQIWQAVGLVSGGPYQAAEPLSWGVDGVGVYVTDSGSTIDFYRTSGSEPAVGNTILGGNSGASLTVASFPSENLSVTAPVAAYPARFADSPTQGGVTGNHELYISAAEPKATIGTTDRDFFTLSAPWGGSTLTNVECVINRSKTTYRGWDLIEQGSRIPFVILKQVIRDIDAWSNTITGSGGPTAWTTLAFETGWQNVSDLSEPRTALSWCYQPTTDTVHVRGFIEANVATGPTEIVSSANGFPASPNRRPPKRLDLFLGTVHVAIHPDGSITYEGPSTQPLICFNNVSFRPDNI